MASVPGKGAQIAGHDHCTYDLPGSSDDLDLPGGLTVENSKGGAGQNDEESKIKAGR